MGAQVLGTGVNSLTTYGWILDPFTAIDDYESPTLIRLLVKVASRTGITVQTGGLFIGFGLYVHTADEDEPGSLPTLGWDPLSDPQSDWLMRWVMTLPPGGNSSDLHFTILEKEFDIRTKRKIPRGAGILAAFQAYNISGTDPTVGPGIAADVRCLIISG